MPVVNRNQVIKVSFICKICESLVEHYTRRPNLIRKEYCEGCLINKRKKYNAPNSKCVHS